MNAWLIEHQWLWQLAGWTMIHFLWLGAIAAIFGGALRLACRGAAPNVRYAASLLTLAALAVLPFVIAARLAANQDAIELAATRRSSAAQRDAPPTPPALRSRVAANPNPDPLAATRKSSAAQRVAPPPSAAPTSSFDARHADFTMLAAVVPYLPWAWLVGAPLTFLLLAAGLIGSQRLRRGGMVLSEGPAFDACQRLRAALGVTRRVSLAACDRIAQPVLVGIARPLILLPAAALAGWTPAELEMVLLHELAHVRRWDNLVNLVQRLVESLLFFHPAVWLVSRQVRRDREECCDAIVVARTAAPREYAELLVSIAATLRGRGRPGSLVAASAMADHPLAGRLRRILKLENEPMRVSTKTLAAVLVAPLLVATATFYAVAAGDDANPPLSQGGARGEIESRDDRVQGGNPRGVTEASPADPAEAAVQPSDSNVATDEKIAALKVELDTEQRLLDAYESAKAQAIQGEIRAALQILADAEAFGNPQIRDVARRRHEMLLALEAAANQENPEPDKVQALALQLIELNRERDDISQAASEAFHQRYDEHPELVLTRSVEAAAKLKKSLAANKRKLNVLEQHARLQRGADDQPRAQMENGAPSGDAPAVLRTIPPQNDVVSSTVWEIRVTFDKPMQDGSWSWCIADEGVFPVTTGKPRYLDNGRTCVLPVALERNKRYAIWINDENHKNFKDESGLPAKPFLLQFSTQYPPPSKGGAKPEKEQSSPLEVSVMQWPLSARGKTTAYLKVKLPPAMRTSQEIEKQSMSLLALVRDPQVIERALQAPEAKELAKVYVKHDLSRWLSARVKVSFPGDGELMELRIEGPESTAESDRIFLTALINAYLAEFEPSDAPPAGGEAPDKLSRADDPARDNSVREAFRYDGQTFDDWRSQWIHELKIERRIEAIDALAAFARAGYAEQAAEAILDVAGEYDFTVFNVSDASPEGKLRHAILEQLWSAKLPASAWLPMLKTRLDADRAKWRPLFDALMESQTYFGGNQPLDEQARNVLLDMAANPQHAPNAGMLMLLIKDRKIAPQVNQLIQRGLKADDEPNAENAIALLGILGFRGLDEYPEQVELLLHQDAGVSRAARTALADARFGDLDDIADRLVKILDDPEQSATYVDAIRALGVLNRIPGELNDKYPRYSTDAREAVGKRLRQILQDGPVELLPAALVALNADATPEYKHALIRSDDLSAERQAEIETAFAKYSEELKQAIAHGE